jgi:hypothetical protein
VDVGCDPRDVVAAAAVVVASPRHHSLRSDSCASSPQHGSEISVLSDAIRDDAPTRARSPARRRRRDVPRAPDPLSARTAQGSRHRERLAVGVPRRRAGRRRRVSVGRCIPSRVLCAHRRGRFGAEAWNTALGRDAGPPAPAAPLRRAFAAGHSQRPAAPSQQRDSGVLVSRDDRLLAAFRVAGEVRTFAPVRSRASTPHSRRPCTRARAPSNDTVVIVLHRQDPRSPAASCSTPPSHTRDPAASWSSLVESSSRRRRLERRVRRD